MNWKRERRLNDEDDDTRFNGHCSACDYRWTEPVSKLLIKIEHRDIYLDEAEKNLPCPRCKQIGGVSLVIANEMRPGAFVGGRP